MYDVFRNIVSSQTCLQRRTTHVVLRVLHRAPWLLCNTSIIHSRVPTLFDQHRTAAQ